MKKIFFFLPVLCALFLLASCSSEVPNNFTEVQRTPQIYPDYLGITIPPNIAPLTFRVLEDGEDYVTRYTYKGGELVVGGKDCIPSIDDWRAMLQAAKGSALQIDVFVKTVKGWVKYKSFEQMVAPEPIDEYLSYRLIAPSYVSYEHLTINQRNLTNFDETEIYNNMLLSTEENGQCINCHSYQNYSTKNMQFHARQTLGGTMIVVDGKPVKYDLKTDSTISGGVYPAWHPTQKLIAYSVNSTGQAFHTRSPEKIEVQDRASDLIVFDIERDMIIPVSTDPNQYEIFPSWSPDGNTLYFCSAYYDMSDTVGTHQGDRLQMDAYQKFKYDLWRIPYNPSTKTFGKKEKVIDAAAIGKSITLPRVSPDGKYLLFTMGDYGCFHIWHKSSDLYLLDLATGKFRKLENVNSPDVESYHTWSSNGRWIVFSSRREDGSYTRSYFAYFDKQHKAHRPFVLPQAYPEHNHDRYTSYNIPEFMKEPVTISPQQFASALKAEPIKAKYQSR